MKEAPSRIPCFIFWTLLALALFFYFSGLSKETINLIPTKTVIIILMLAALFFARLLLEALLPKRQVVLAKTQQGVLSINPEQRYGQIHLSKQQIKDVKLAKSTFSSALYFFFDDNRVAVFSSSDSEVRRLKTFVDDFLHPNTQIQ